MEIVPTAAALGAEIKGLDLSQPLSAGDLEQLRAAWDKYLVLTFRGHEELR